ncbi:MAG: FkbM family methyltransferase [Gemmatimonadota bacterium]
MRLPFGLRRFTSAAIRPLRVQIKHGPNQGCRWSLAAAGRHRAGAFEPERMAVIEAMLSPGDCFWELGAHHGYVTLIASRAVGQHGRVYAFEPSSYNFPFLEKHVRWNRLSNTIPLNLAVSDQDGIGDFGGGGSSQTFHLGGGTETVRVASIGGLLSEGLKSPDMLKIDVEGAEGAVLSAGAMFLGPTSRLIVSLHSMENYRQVTATLRDRGLLILESAGVRELVKRGEWTDDDPDIAAVGPRHGELLRRLAMLEYFAGRA